MSNLVGVGGIEPPLHKFLMEISAEVSQTSGQVDNRGAENRTRATPTPWVHTATVLHPDSLFVPHACGLPLPHTPTGTTGPAVATTIIQQN